MTGPLAPRVVVAADAADFKEKGRGFAAGCVEGLHRFAQGATALRAEGGGGALRAQILKKPARALRHFDRSGAEWRNLPL